MLLEVNWVKNKTLKKLLSHIIPLLFVFLLIPVFLLFEITIVLPELAESVIEYYVHIFNAIFIMSNVISNGIHGAFINTSIHGRFLENANKDKWTLCTVCECSRPPRAWHCDVCNICILKRDHHCSFLATCVGYYNYRYFIMFTFYIFIAMLYSLYYNIRYVTRVFSWNGGLLILKFFLPLVNFVVDYGWETWCIFLLEINIIVCVFAGFLFCFHANNILIGRTTPERQGKTEKHIEFDQGLKANIIEVFGKRWYLVWISAFINSPLPGNGIDWLPKDKCT